MRVPLIPALVTAAPHSRSATSRSIVLRIVPAFTRTLASIGACGAALMLSGRVDAQVARHPMSFDDVMALKSLGSIEISPDGRFVAYTVSDWEHQGAPGSAGDNPTRRSHIWLVPSDGGTPRQLTYGERGESGPQWSPDGTTLAFTAARGTSDVGQRPQIWLLPLSGGEARQLTHARNGASGFSWSPDGTRIAYLSVDSLPRATTIAQQHRDDAEVYESNFHFTHLWVVDVATGAESEVAHGNFTLSALGIVGVPQWSPDGTRIAFVASPSTMLRDLRGGVYVVTVATHAIENVAPEFRQPAGGLIQPAWSPDGKTLAFANFPQSTTVEGDSIPDPLLVTGDLMLYDVATHKLRTVKHPAVDVTLSSLQWTPDGRSIVFSTTDSVYVNVFEYDVAANKFSRLTNGVVVHGLSLSRTGNRVAFGLETPTSPADVYVSDLSFAAPRKLTTINPQMAGFELGTTRVITWKSDGLTITGVLLEPVGYEPGHRYPLLVEEHGGPTGTSLNDFKATSSSPGQVWAGRGWAVLYPNPRGSEGFGEKFMLANIKDLGGGDFRDIMRGVDDVIRLGIADSSKMAFEGWSYGGYMTAWVVGHTSRFKAARMGAGMSDLASMYGTTEIPGYIGMFHGGAPSARTLALYREQSPITYASHVTTPLLILHGAVDPRVPPGQALEMYRALRDQGKPVELVLYPREQHGFTEYYHLLDRMQRDYNWITKYTLGTASPAQAAAR